MSEQNKNQQDKKQNEIARKDNNVVFYKDWLFYVIVSIGIIFSVIYINANITKYICIQEEIGSSTEANISLTKDNILSEPLLFNATTGNSNITNPLSYNATNNSTNELKNTTNGSKTAEALETDTEQSNDLLKTTNNTALSEISQNSLNDNEKSKASPESTYNDATNNLIINPILIQWARDILVSILIIAVFAFLYVPLKKAQGDRKKFGFTLFIIIISLISIMILGFLWYALLWFPHKEKVEAFSGLMSTLAFFGLIVTILIQVYQHKNNVALKLKELEIQRKAKEHDEKKERLRLEIETLENQSTVLSDIYKKRSDNPNSNGIYKNCYFYVLSTGVEIDIKKEKLYSLLPTFTTKRENKSYKNRNKMYKEIKPYLDNENITLQEFVGKATEAHLEYLTKNRE